MRRRLFLAIPRHPSQVPARLAKAHVRAHSLFLTLRSRLAQYFARASPTFPAGRSDPLHVAALRAGEEPVQSFLPLSGEVFSVDAVFIVTLIVLYLLTLWVVRSLSRLGGLE